MTPDESKSAMLALVDETVSLLGGGQWTDRGVQSPLDCTLPSGSTGVNFDVATTGPASRNPEADIAKVKEFWTSQHLKTRVVISTNAKDTTIRLYGTGGPVMGISFYADTERMSLGGESVCVPGDAGKLIDEMPEDGE